MAEIWQCFEKNPADRDKARCRKCQQILSCKGFSTSGLLRHMKNKHEINMTPPANTDNSATKGSASILPTKQPSMLKFVKRQSLAEIVARLAAKDGFAINAITKSDFIRQSISNRGYSLPTSRSAVMKLVSDYYDYARLETRKEIQIRIQSGKLLSLTLDEWTSQSNKRYMNVNVHFGDGSFYNLGLCKIQGSLPAEKVLEVVRNRVQQFGIQDDHIVASTTDGARVMVKFGRIFEYFHQLCYNHAIYLGVCDVLYKDQPSEPTNADDSDDGDSDIDSQDGEFQSDLYTTRFGEVLKRIRRAEKVFRKSPVKNAILQEKIIKKLQKTLQMLLDVKTRWNSTKAKAHRGKLKRVGQDETAG